MAYPYVQGKHIATDAPPFQSLKDVADLIARFHTTNIDKIEKISPYRKEYLRIIRPEEVKDILHKDISDECNYIERVFKKYTLSNNILIHGDLGFPNLLFDDNNNLCGVLDLDTVAITNNPLFELTAFRYMKLDDLFVLIDLLNKSYKAYGLDILIDKKDALWAIKNFCYMEVAHYFKIGKSDIVKMFLNCLNKIDLYLNSSTHNSNIQ